MTDTYLTEPFLGGTSEGTHISTYAPTGGGIVDDYAKFQTALTASYATGMLVLQPGKTYLLGTCPTVSSSIIIVGNGATLKKTTGLVDYSLIISAADVTIYDLIVDGNRAGGNTNNPGGFYWSGTRGNAYRCKVSNIRDIGWTVTGSGILDAHDCQANDVYNSAGQGSGFLAISGGVLRGYNLTGNNNGSAGAYLPAGAGAGCYLDGTFNNNSNAGVYIACNDGRIGNLLTNNNANEGVHFEGGSGWSYDYIESNDSGQALNGEYTVNPSASGAFIGGASGMSGATFVARRAQGYGMEVVRDGSLNPTLDCTFENLYISQCADPALLVSGGSKKNTFGTITATDCTVAVSLGESTGQGDQNHFELVHAVRTSFAVIRGDLGSNNTFGRVIAVDCTQGAPYVSFVKWDTANCLNNTIENFDSYNPTTTPPTYLMECTAGATGNLIRQGSLKTAGTTPLLDAVPGANIVKLYRNTTNTVTYSASMTFDASKAQFHKITVTNGVAMTINAPTNPSLDDVITLDILNSSGGAMGAITWNAVFKLAGAFTNPATTKHRTIQFFYDGTNWLEINRAAADI